MKWSRFFAALRRQLTLLKGCHAIPYRIVCKMRMGRVAATILALFVVAVFAAIRQGIADPNRDAYVVLKDLQTLIAATIGLGGVTIAYLGVTRKVVSEEASRLEDKRTVSSIIYARLRDRFLAITTMANDFQASGLVGIKYYADHGKATELSELVRKSGIEIEAHLTQLPHASEGRVPELVACISILEKTAVFGHRLAEKWIEASRMTDAQFEEENDDIDRLCFQILDLIQKWPHELSFTLKNAARTDNWYYWYEHDPNV